MCSEHTPWFCLKKFDRGEGVRGDVEGVRKNLSGNARNAASLEICEGGGRRGKNLTRC